ncbi:fasciclin domain-containing protein [uncultured Sneathiella sp.]|uniref:fasciclin domain-containing protein n=1 Tax=uncultured Sneathiella sp. TaxID=879315 RepID=UPI00338E0966
MAAKAAPAEKDIVVTAVEAGKFNTLVAAVKAADLVETLQSPGPFTVFAPTDAAFDKLPAGTVEDLLKPENKAKLVEILTYHVVSGVVPASAVVGKKVDADSVQGSKIMIDGMDGVVLNGSAKVVAADVIASNGVIHVIDTVILPPAN